MTNKRFVLRAATAAALLLFALHARGGAQAVRKQENVALSAKEEVIDSLTTKAGVLSIVRLGEDTDLRMELRLNRKTVQDLSGNMYAGFRAHFRNLEVGEAVVMSLGSGGSGCPEMFQIVRVEGSGKVGVTEEFGDCSDSPNITLETLPAERLLLRFPGYYRLSQQEEPGFRKPPPTTWVYTKGVLKELKPPAKKRS
ncbi:MAG TPA: hypothetical protein VF588_10860 [Pyrinomonadaceae bacterium]|jgi:hypothetical protein